MVGEQDELMNSNLDLFEDLLDELGSLALDVAEPKHDRFAPAVVGAMLHYAGECPLAGTIWQPAQCSRKVR